MASTGPGFRRSTEEAPRGWVVNPAATVYRQSMIARYNSGALQGYCDNVGASANMTILGCAEQNGGAQPAGHTLTMSPEVKALEQILVFTFTGPALSTANRDAMVFGVDENTPSLTPGSGIPVGQLLEVIDATHGKVGVGPHFVARAGAAAAALLTSANPFQVDEWLAPAATSTTALHAALASTVAPQTVLAAAMVAGGLTALAAFPRNITITGGGTTADAPASAVATGTDIDGNALTETITLTAGSGTGAKAFKTLASVVYAAAASVNATMAIGIGSVFGLSKTITSRALRLNVIEEVYAATTTGSVVTNGTYTSAATSPPHGSYAGNSAPDGTKSYALVYEHS